MTDFIKPNIKIEEISLDNNYGRFVLEPLERGYGITLGNSLRRILMSSLPGAAVSQVKLDGVLHEFSTLPGVKEDITEIVMNLKSLAIRNTSVNFNEVKTAVIDASGEMVVTAADIKTDSDVEIVNKDQVIATLSGGPDCKLYMELTITNGRGYVSAEKNKGDNPPIGVIPIDSAYTPVTRVNHIVEDTRVGQITDYDKLTLDVYTNGTISPDEAISNAAQTLIGHLKLFTDLTDHIRNPETIAASKFGSAEKLMATSIDDMELSVRSSNSLKRSQIYTVNDLVEYSFDDLSKIRNLGRKSIDEIAAKLKELGLSFRSPDVPSDHVIIDSGEGYDDYDEEDEEEE